MSNNKKNVVVRLYGVTLAEPLYRTHPFGHGCEPFLGGIPVQYVDYFLEDIISLAVAQNKFSDLFNFAKAKEKELNGI